MISPKKLCLVFSTLIWLIKCLWYLTCFSVIHNSYKPFTDYRVLIRSRFDSLARAFHIWYCIIPVVHHETHCIYFSYLQKYQELTKFYIVPDILSYLTLFYNAEKNYKLGWERGKYRYSKTAVANRRSERLATTALR